MKKKSRVAGKGSKLHNPYDSTARKTERSAVAVLMHWMRNIIEEKGIDLGFPDVDTTGADRKSPDIVIYESRRSQRVLCVIEAKLPYFNVYNEEGLKKPALEKANKRKAKYFGATNFKSLVWYDTARVNANDPEEKQIIDIIQLSDVEDITQLESSRYSTASKKNIEIFLKRLYAINTGKESLPKLPIDERLIKRLHETIRVLSKYYADIIYDQFHKDKSFARNLRKWFKEQNLIIGSIERDIDKVARQTAYLIINKILFYDLLQARRPGDLNPLEIPKSLTKGSLLKSTLQAYFEEALKIDYETVFTTDFIDDIAFPDSTEIVKEIKDLIVILQRYDFGKLGYDIIGRIFERLIPEDERHNLGQYFTRSDVVDLILNFCIIHEDDKILDPSCGTGTFLKRAYQQKRLMNSRLTHAAILKALWGNDIAKFPSTLAIINLAINDLAVDKNYPNIICEDFFALKVGSEGFDPENWRKKRAKTLGIKEREILYPSSFDGIVGNPPYTRQEEIPEIGVEKGRLIKEAMNYGGKALAKFSKRAGIHAYFFVHGYKFLKEDGYFGFIVSNSWMDVDYGKGLQEFFLKHYKIKAIIESKVERWFEDADINTCIIILQKCVKKEDRDSNLVRFVYLKKPLADLIPPAENGRSEELKRRDAIEKLKETILAHNKFYQNEDMRIFPITQKALWEEAYDEDEKAFVGAKWGKYLRAPEIFFKILDKGKDKFVTLKKVATVRRGFTTGANEFFYLTQEEIKKRKIEKEFWMHKDPRSDWVPNYVIKNPIETRNIVLSSDQCKFIVLMIHNEKNELRGKNILKYINWGIKNKINLRPTCIGRGKRWYDLRHREFADALWIEFYFKSYRVLLNNRVFESDKFYGITFNKKRLKTYYVSYLNSTLYALYREIYGFLSLGLGASKLPVYMISALPVIESKFFIDSHKETFRQFSKKSGKRVVGTVFEEIGANSPEEVFLEKVKPDRRELDKIVMGDILGLTDEEQLEVYRAVVDLVKSRIDRAKSVKKNKLAEGVDLEGLSEAAVNDIREEG